jgi:hypothetical protein
MHVDPLTDRFAGTTTDGSHYQWPNCVQNTWQWNGPPHPAKLAGGGAAGVGEYNSPMPCPNVFYYDFIGYEATNSTNGVPNSDGRGWASPYAVALLFGAWAQNIPTAGGNDAYYADPDGIVRPGNDCCWDVSNSYTWNANTSQWVPAINDGVSQLPGGYSLTTGAGPNPKQAMGRRPLVLNRPFRSVGELGYAYRDLPFKTLDFFTSYSADAALLDVFSVTDQPAVVAGQIDPNTAPAPVLQAILSGAGKQEALPSYDIAAEAAAISGSISAFNAAAPGSFANRADLVTKLGVQFQLGTYSAGNYTNGGKILQSGTSSIILQGFSASSNSSADQTDKTYLEAPVRALADVTNTRTWNLMIDVIAQTGSFVPDAPKSPGALNSSFVVQGERHYWLHIAVDRFTGKVIDQQLEPVYE